MSSQKQIKALLKNLKSLANGINDDHSLGFEAIEVIREQERELAMAAARELEWRILAIEEKPCPARGRKKK